MKKIALIGANGQLGTDIAKIFSTDSFFKVIPLTTKEIDITDQEKTATALEKIQPQTVINTAAFHRVDEIEDNPQPAFAVNVIAEKFLAELCEKNSWELLYCSTDYVYGADKKRSLPYRETDPAGPVSTYGVSKLAGELVTQVTCRRHFIVRLCGLFGAVGSLGKGTNFVETMIRLAKEKGEVRVVNDQICTPTYTKEVAENLRHLLKTDSYGLYHMTAQGECSWYQFASEIFRLLKIKVKCLPVSSDQFPTRAKRPGYSVLENYNLKQLGIDKMKDWQEGLRLYLQEKGYLK